MAHELSYTDGRANFFSVGQTAWHREGTVLTEAPSYEEALVLAGLDYTVEKRPTYRAILGADGQPVDYVENASACVIVRSDTGAELGSVGPSYAPVQNAEAFHVLRPLIDEGFLRLETGGVLRKGADAWLLGQWDLSRFGPIVREVFADEVVPFALVAANHDGRRGVLVADTPIRVVCANTLGSAESTSSARITVRHTGDARQRLVEAATSLWGGVIERYDALAGAYRALKATHLSAEEFKVLVLDVVAPDPRDNPSFVPDARLAEMVVARAERKRDRLTHLWTSGKGHQGDGSAWEAYNGVVEALDHEVDLFPARNGSYRTASLAFGALAATKKAVLDGLLAHARAVGVMVA